MSDIYDYEDGRFQQFLYCDIIACVKFKLPRDNATGHLKTFNFNFEIINTNITLTRCGSASFDWVKCCTVHRRQVNNPYAKSLQDSVNKNYPKLPMVGL